MSAWFKYEAILQIIIAGLIVGAGLPALFSLAVRMNAEGSGVVAHEGVTGVAPKPVLSVISWVIFALVLTAVIVGVLFVARDFIGHHTGLYILGAKPK
jgi:membrane-anchored glycerophosphoryl diester phosphodiesterase (GDPDase)